jgi:hypothetical protein
MAITEAVVRYLEPRLHDGSCYTNAIMRNNLQGFPAHFTFINFFQATKQQGLSCPHPYG